MFVIVGPCQRLQHTINFGFRARSNIIAALAKLAGLLPFVFIVIIVRQRRSIVIILNNIVVDNKPFQVAVLIFVVITLRVFGFVVNELG